jgi:two-component system, OmpR family, sensor histidine kinase KdpD
MKSANMRSSALLSHSWQYLLAFSLIAFVTAIFFVLQDVLDTTLIAMLYLLPLGIITALWGLGPGISSAVITFFALNYFFIEPYYSLKVHQPGEIVILVVFLLVAVVISQLVGQARAGLAAARASEQEATQLYELSTALTGLHDDRTIAQILARQVQDVSRSEYVEVGITGPSVFVCRLPEITPPARPPELIVPIEAARGMLGEIRFWRAEPVTTIGEKRLLQTFAGQGALALERARLDQAESRAKVLEESDRLKSAILSSVSHELRTPLSTIKAASSSLRSGEVGWESTACTELIAAIDDAADHLNLLVGNLLDISRIESGALRPKREWNILAEIVGSVLERMKNHTIDHKINVDIPETLPLVPVDYVQLQQVFTNLLSNSLKYAPANTAISVRAWQAEEQVHVQVSNKGPQIPPQDLERIFDKFYRTTTAERVTGTGLGLSICKGIIEAHGGRIWAENLTDGLAFNFVFPLTWDGVPPPQFSPESETE